MQLELFNRPRAVVHAFPLARRRQLVRNTARWLEMREGKQRDRFWRSTLNHLTAELQLAGLDRPTIELELADFRAAVVGETTRRFIMGETDQQADGVA